MFCGQTGPISRPMDRRLSEIFLVAAMLVIAAATYFIGHTTGLHDAPQIQIKKAKADQDVQAIMAAVGSGVSQADSDDLDQILDLAQQILDRRRIEDQEARRTGQ